MAARNGYLEQIPSNLLTEENLMIRNFSGITALHKAAETGNLSPLIGMDFSEKVRDIVGNEWYEENVVALRKAKDSLTPNATEDLADMDIF